jgi:hypothetical protein
MESQQAPIEDVTVAVYTVPTDAPEADGTLSWDSTTLRQGHPWTNHDRDGSRRLMDDDVHAGRCRSSCVAWRDLQCVKSE